MKFTSFTSFEECARVAGCVTLAIPLRTPTTVKWVPAVARMGDFAVTPSDTPNRRYPARKWVLTHVCTGLKVPGAPVVLKRALGCLEALRHVPAATPEQLAASADVIRSVALRHLAHVSSSTDAPTHAEYFVEVP